MKITLSIKKLTIGNGASCFVANATGEEMKELNDLSLEPTADYDVRFTKKCGVHLPQEEGKYSLEAKSAEAWIDKREEIDYPTVRINRLENPIFTKLA